MTKARRKMAEDIKLADAVCEVLDARIPRSSANPDMDELTRSKPRLVVLNRADLADPAETKRWAAEFKRRGFGTIETDSRTGRGTERLQGAVRALLSDKLAQRSAKGQTGGAVRLMVAGIPNVGKSSFINRISGRRATKTADRPGVTRGRQWISCGAGMELLDTPGILWHRLDGEETGENLAITGAIGDAAFDAETLGSRLMLRLWEVYPERVVERYKLRDGDAPEPDRPLDIIALRRGFLISGGEPDAERAAAAILDDFRGGRLGRVTLELCGQEIESPTADSGQRA
jgi:ribosome biogenesis GTPase A